MSEKDPEKSDQDTNEACRILKKNGKYGRVFAANDFIPRRLTGVFSCQKFSIGHAPGIEIERRGKCQNRVIPAQVGWQLGREQLGDTAVTGESSADPEVAYGHQQRIEIESFAVPERVQCVRRACAASDADP